MPFEVKNKMDKVPTPKMKEGTITIYGLKTCPYTRKAVGLMSSNDVFINIEDYGTKDEFVDLFKIYIGDHTTVPVVFEGARFIGGCEEFENHLKTKSKVI